MLQFPTVDAAYEFYATATTPIPQVPR
jgi:hypothetical protein